MNRYGRPGGGGSGPSKASATTLCQKCLQKDMYIPSPMASRKLTYHESHYSYECKSAAQERPYVSRPSRTQQLQNPKLIPKLTSDVPQELLRKKGIADEQLAKAEELRGRKRSVEIDDQNSLPPAPKRVRAASVSSVSTISTNKSVSPEPTNRKSKPRYATRSPSPPRRARDSTPPLREASNRDTGDRSVKKEIASEKKRRRDSLSSANSYSTEEERGTRERTSSRNTRRRYRQSSPTERGRGTVSRSPQRENGGRQRMPYDRPGGFEAQPVRVEHIAPKERSLSPFSKRLALTQSRNAGH